MDVTYGLDIKDPNDRFNVLLGNFGSAFERAFAPGKYLVEVFPVLRHLPAWFPGATFHRDAAGYRTIFTAMRNEPFDQSLQNLVCICNQALHDTR